MSVDLDALRTLAEQATPGPWRDVATMGAIVSDDPDAIAKRGENNFRGYGGAIVLESCERADREFIIASDPLVVLALVEAVQAAREYVYRDPHRPHTNASFVRLTNALAPFVRASTGETR